MGKDLDVCSRCKGDHPNLDCMYRNVKKETILRCSRCGGEHPDFYCMYFKTNKIEECSNKVENW